MKYVNTLKWVVFGFVLSVAVWYGLSAALNRVAANAAAKEGQLRKEIVKLSTPTPVPDSAEPLPLDLPPADAGSGPEQPAATDDVPASAESDAGVESFTVAADWLQAERAKLKELIADLAAQSAEETKLRTESAELRTKLEAARQKLSEIEHNAESLLTERKAMCQGAAAPAAAPAPPADPQAPPAPAKPTEDELTKRIDQLRADRQAQQAVLISCQDQLAAAQFKLLWLPRTKALRETEIASRTQKLDELERMALRSAPVPPPAK